MSVAVQAPTLVNDERQLSFDLFPAFEEDLCLSADGCRAVIPARSLEPGPASILRIQ